MGNPSWMEIPKALEGLPESREFSQFGRGWEGESGGLVWWEEGVTYCLNGPPPQSGVPALSCLEHTSAHSFVL